MPLKIEGLDIGILSFGRRILSQNPHQSLDFSWSHGGDHNFKIESSLEILLQRHTRWGRIGIWYDRQNYTLSRYLKTLNFSIPNYHPQDPKRAEKSPKISIFPVPVLRTMALEGLADSVEFRRLSRKHIRHLKRQHIDTLFLPEPIFAEPRTQKILQHLAGTQIKVYTIVDFFDVSPDLSSTKAVIRIFHPPMDRGWLHSRAEKILGRKLASDCFFEVAETLK
jgi:hypothetical protein